MKKLLIKFLVSLNLLSPTPTKELPKQPSKELKVVEERTTNYSQTFYDEFYGQAEYGKDKTTFIRMANENGDILQITIDTWKDVYTMQYNKEGEKIEYHYHDIQSLNDDIKLHQENLNNNFKEWEKLEGLQVPRNTHITGFENKGRQLRVQMILRMEENGIDTEEEKIQVEQLKQELKMYNGFDIDNNIDYELILGSDWRCLIHTEEGKQIVNDYLENN